MEITWLKKAQHSVKYCCVQKRILRGTAELSSSVETRPAVSALKNDTDKMTLWLWFLMIFWYIHRLVTYSAIMRSFLLRLMGNNTKTHSLTLCKKREVYVCVWWGKHLSLNGKSLANLSSQSSANPADEEAERT